MHQFEACVSVRLTVWELFLSDFCCEFRPNNENSVFVCPRFVLKIEKFLCHNFYLFTQFLRLAPLANLSASQPRVGPKAEKWSLWSQGLSRTFRPIAPNPSSIAPLCILPLGQLATSAERRWAYIPKYIWWPVMDGLWWWLCNLAIIIGHPSIFHMNIMIIEQNPRELLESAPSHRPATDQTFIYIHHHGSISNPLTRISS